MFIIAHTLLVVLFACPTGVHRAHCNSSRARAHCSLSSVHRPHTQASRALLDMYSSRDLAASGAISASHAHTSVLTRSDIGSTHPARALDAAAQCSPSSASPARSYNDGVASVRGETPLVAPGASDTPLQQTTGACNCSSVFCLGCLDHSSVLNTASTSTKASKTTNSTQNRRRQRRKPSTVRTRKHHGTHEAAAHSDEALQLVPSDGDIGATNSPAFFLGPQRLSAELPVSRRNLASSTGRTLGAFLL